MNLNRDKTSVTIRVHLHIYTLHVLLKSLFSHDGKTVTYTHTLARQHQLRGGVGQDTRPAFLLTQSIIFPF